MPTTYPHGYGRTLLDIDALFARHHVDKMHPEFCRRLRAWLIAQDGQIGIGGSWRDTGSQPSKPGFAPEGKSFHQYQRFASGLVAFCAVDLVARNGTNVHRAPTWNEVPAQGSAEATAWGVHCNIGSESWHMQPVLRIGDYDGIDGWGGWITTGSPDPVAAYPLPTDPKPEPPKPTPDPEEPDMAPRFFKTSQASPTLWVTTDNVTAVHVTEAQWVALGTPAPEVLTAAQAKKFAYLQSLQHDIAIG